MLLVIGYLNIQLIFTKYKLHCVWIIDYIMECMVMKCTLIAMLILVYTRKLRLPKCRKEILRDHHSIADYPLYHKDHRHLSAQSLLEFHLLT